MAQYLIVYLGGNQPSTPEEGKQHFVKYQEWLTSEKAKACPFLDIDGSLEVSELAQMPL